METITLILQILTLLVAAVGPLLAYRYARKLAVSSNRQAWIDALRADLADLIALKENRMTIMRELSQADLPAVTLQNATQKVLLDKNVELQAARYRVRLRLRSGNDKHDRLIAAVEALSTAKYQNDRNPLRKEILEAAEAVITYTWNKVENGE